MSWPRCIDPARGVIKGRQFQHDRVIGEPVAWARVMSQIREVDELVIFDVTHNPPDIELLERITKEINIPLSYGGGIHDIDTAMRVAKIAEKLVLQDEAMIFEVGLRSGAQAAIGCINGGNYATDAVRLVAAGAGEILIQSIERDGMMTGYDLEAIRAVRAAVNVPLTVSSGAGTAQHFVEAVQAGADGVAAGACWAFSDLTPNEVKRAIADAGYPVRTVGSIHPVCADSRARRGR